MTGVKGLPKEDLVVKLSYLTLAPWVPSRLMLALPCNLANSRLYNDDADAEILAEVMILQEDRSWIQQTHRESIVLDARIGIGDTVGT